MLATLALLAFVAGQFAQRIDRMASQTGLLRAQAQGDVSAASARSEALFLVLTQAPGPIGLGTPPGPLWPADGRWLRLRDGAAVRLQDQRGLLSLNVIDREPLFRLLVAAGVPPDQVPRLIDSLEDYTDVDSLRRLNGAERPHYLEAGLPSPRNDWMLSTRELCQIPAWIEQAGLCDRVAPWVSTRRGAEINPNTAPLEVLRALVPQALPGQIERLSQQRRPNGLEGAAMAETITALKLQSAEPIFWVGNTFVLSVWAEGQARATEYNLLMTPESLRAPWLVTEVHRVTRPDTADMPPHPTTLAPPAVPASATPFAQAQAGHGLRETVVRP